MCSRCAGDQGKKLELMFIESLLSLSIKPSFLVVSDILINGSSLPSFLWCKVMTFTARWRCALTNGSNVRVLSAATPLVTGKNNVRAVLAVLPENIGEISLVKVYQPEESEFF